MSSPRTAFSIVAAAAAGGVGALLVRGLGLGLLPAALLGVNAAAFLLYGFDKAAATWGPPHGSPGGWRVPEVVLLGLAALGGAAGAWAAMLAFRHKTQKSAFRWGVPVLLVLEIAGGLAATLTGMVRWSVP